MAQNLSKTFQLVDKACELEARISELYQACAEHWPEDRPFWEDIAQQEREHSQGMGTMRRMIERDPSAFELMSPVNPVAIDAFIARLDEVTQKVRSGQYDKLRILATAADIEQSVLESSFAAAVKTANLGCQEIQTKIASETRQHREAFVQRIEMVKKP